MCHEYTKNFKNGSAFKGTRASHRPALNDTDYRDTSGECAPGSDLSNGFPPCQVFVFNLKTLLTSETLPVTKEPFSPNLL